MSAADTAMVLAIVSQLGTAPHDHGAAEHCFFLKPLAAQDGLVTARVIRAGKKLVFGAIDIVGVADGKACAAPAPPTRCCDAPLSCLTAWPARRAGPPSPDGERRVAAALNHAAQRHIIKSRPMARVT